jgi:hypothetical protein
MSQGLPINLPQASCINCGDVLPYADFIDEALWARCVHCDQVIGPWRDLSEVMTLDSVEAVADLSLVKGGCGGKSHKSSDGGCSGGSCGEL